MQPEDRFQTAGEFLEALESQQVVELAPGQPAGNRKRYPLLAGGVLLAAAFGTAALLFAGREENPAGGLDSPQGRQAFSQSQEEPVEMADIGGREYPVNLTSLDLRELGLTDEELEGLAKMTDLVELDLRGNEMTDLSPLSGMANLKELRLSGDIGGNDGISDLSPLSGLSRLKVLHLPAANIEDLSPLSGLVQLEDLALIDPESDLGLAEDITPLASLVNLKELYLKIGVISDLTPLSA